MAALLILTTCRAMTMSLDPRRHAYRADLADEALRGRVDAARFAAARDFVLAVPATALRRHPTRDAPLESEALAGETVRVFETRADGWSWVQLGRDRHVGYVETATLAPPGAAPTHRLTVPRSLVYPEPDMKTPPLSWLPLGARFAAAAEDGRFLRLARGGFVIARHAAALDAAPAADFVAVAEAFLSVPYLWGGKTGLGIDCSGLVQVALDAAGHAPPRDSDMQQAELGRDVEDRGALRRGDLVFWKGHVGVMRDARTLLHANGHHMLVAEEPLAAAAARTESRGGGPIVAVRRL
jgi:cell wall-associated NlpC family hydrolase